MMTVSMGLMKGGYMTVVSADEILAALLLLTNRFVPLALTLIAPILVGILTFHIATSPGMIEVDLAWSYRKAFGPMLAAKVRPGV